MIPEIESIYASATEARHKDPNYQWTVRFLWQLAEEQELRVRWDAIYFIANNMIDMVLMPLSLVVKKENDEARLVLIEDGQFAKFYAEDLKLIVFSAAEVAKQRGRADISSTSVLLALSEVFDRLNINDVKLWGRAS